MCVHFFGTTYSFVVRRQCYLRFDKHYLVFLPCFHVCDFVFLLSSKSLYHPWFVLHFFCQLIITMTCFFKIASFSTI